MQVEDHGSYKSFLYDNTSVITDRVCYTLKEIDNESESASNTF